ncbi:MAG: 2-succinylbenzoate--CoA ligase [Chlamydiia bacterium]|nr:2-succinylbenzoate--CoA ligase [Chlamydiia bacterium]MCH9615419.1 2-succinylbenzoate--CoA ligase [Chlamydiia bacterium]MCH9628259.1 2-succinylbenzoate--CoA ligase [Chlamydiia bacterium]
MQCPIHLHAQKYPRRLALIRHGEKYTWSECDRHLESIPELRLFADLRANRCYTPLNPYLPEKIRNENHQVLKGIKGYAACLYTSGSTSAPKIACFSYENLFYSALGANILAPFEGNDRWLLSLPLYHVGGIGILMRWALSGACIVIPKKGDEKESLLNDKITHVSFVPTQLKRYPLSLLANLKVILLGGAPLPKISLPNLYPTYGLTEMSSQVMTRNCVLEYREMKIAPDGEILVKGKTLFQGYFADGNVNLPLNEEGYFHTGDLFDGTKITGRKDRQFISGGENIQPEEIESALSKIPQVLKAHVRPFPDDEYGMRPIASVVLENMLNESVIREALSEVLPAYKIPVKFEVSHQLDMPSSSSWKS